MEVSSNSMKVARVTVSATTQGLMMGRDFDLMDEGFELVGELAGDPIPGSVSRTAVPGSSVNTAWLAKARFSLSLVATGSCKGRPHSFIYDGRPLYLIWMF
jgi:hypothetical protein